MTAPDQAPPANAEPVRWWPEWRRALPLGLMLGGTGGMYFLGNTFIPDYLHAIGRPDLVTASLGMLNFGQVPASFVILLFARFLTGNTTVLIASPLIAGACLTAFFVPLPGLIVPAALLIGFCCGLQLVASLALPPLLVASGDVHHLSAGTFAIGYFVSFLMPPLGGAIWDVTGAPASAFVAGILSVALVVAAAAMLPRVSIGSAASAPRR
jgi:CP family cyanate transporter-like MFS transporter